jgi:CheY-like chemotaxis protein
VPNDVLVVDDDPTMLGALAAVIQMRGIPCVTAESGPEALRVTAAPPGLILMDLNMPEMDGPETFRRLRGSGIASPTVLMSATVKEGRQLAEELGFDAYLQKPFTLPEIFALLDRFLAPEAV